MTSIPVSVNVRIDSKGEYETEGDAQVQDRAFESMRALLTFGMNNCQTRTFAETRQQLN